jgi:uncharacterized protein
MSKITFNQILGKISYTKYLSGSFTLLILLSFTLFPGCDYIFTQNLKKINAKIGGVSVSLEVVATPADRQKGLMYRTSMGENDGMIFVFPSAQPQSFWMKNTLIPLDLGYFDYQGYLIEVYTMHPDNGEKFYNSSEPVLYAIEMNAGWYAKHNLKKYAKLELPYPIQGR